MTNEIDSPTAAKPPLALRVLRQPQAPWTAAVLLLGGPLNPALLILPEARAAVLTLSLSDLPFLLACYTLPCLIGAIVALRRIRRSRSMITIALHAVLWICASMSLAFATWLAASMEPLFGTIEPAPQPPQTLLSTLTNTIDLLPMILTVSPIVGGPAMLFLMAMVWAATTGKDTKVR